MKVKISADVSSISSDDMIAQKQEVIEIFKSIGMKGLRFSTTDAGKRKAKSALQATSEIKYSDVLKLHGDAISIIKKLQKMGFTISSFDYLRKGPMEVQVSAFSNMGGGSGTLSVDLVVTG